MQEIWKNVSNYKGLYIISNYGRIISLRKNKILTPKFKNNGYTFIQLCKNGVKKKYYIHRLVAIHFIDNPKKLPLVCHINDIRDDNRACNLFWGTHQDNINDCYLKGRNPNSGGPVKPVRCTTTGKTFESVKAVAIFLNVSQPTVSMHLRGKSKTCRGRVLEFITK